MEKVRLGIIGFGNMGTSHYENIKAGKCPEIEVTAIADTNPDRIKYANENLPESIAKFDDGIKLLDSGLVDAVMVATPHYSHPTFALECFKRNIHVIVEKPAGVYTKQVKEMNEAAEKSNVVFAVDFNQRTNHVYRAIHDLVHSGKLGSLRRVTWIITNWYRPQAYYNSGSWRATWAGEGGGVLLNQCPHQLDLLQWICGLPVKVESHMKFGKWHDIEVEDDVTTFMEFENGATGTFITTTGDACGTNRLEINLDKGKIIATSGGFEVYEMEMTEQEFSKVNTVPFGSPKREKIDVPTDGKNPQHVGVLNAFAGAILRGEPLVAPGVEGIRGLTLSNAMHLSQWLGKTVSIPFDDDLYYNELMKRVSASKIKSNVTSVVADTSNTYNA